MKWHSSIAFCKHSLVGVDVKSHQVNSNIPHAVIVLGNEKQDEGCDTARNLPAPPDVAIPTGGFFAYITYRGRSITNNARSACRDILRNEALSKWKARTVQGKMAHVHSQLDTA